MHWCEVNHGSATLLGSHQLSTKVIDEVDRKMSISAIQQYNV